MRKAFLAVGVCGVASMVVSACLSRPVTSTEPHTSNINVEPIRNDVVDKIDLLFMIDNSQSMGDKQALLAKAVPKLVARLVVPRCLNAAGAIHERATLDEACPADFEPEFAAVSDIHVAVITSSLGSHGAGESSPCDGGPPNDDHAWLLPKVRKDKNLADYAGTGFLAWDPRQKLTPPGGRDSVSFGMQFGEMVKATGEAGCGYEASLESWYRFLIDPEPPLQITFDAKNHNVVSGVDTELLAQRQAFLRPDSLVAIVMLTDENDCSINDDTFGNRIANLKAAAPRATSACARDPNDPCCLPCESSAPSGCTPPASDPACKDNIKLTKTEDPTNLRCMRNKQRFGVDFLYPTSRYVDALTQPQVVRRSDGQLVQNPLFQVVAGKSPRTPELIYLAGIVGVPWQDIADDASRSGPGLHYLSASQLTAQGRWDVIVGDASKNQEPSDPFMHESVAPRNGTNPITSDAIVEATSLNPHANAINGHEQVPTTGDDLQYACTFLLNPSTACAEGGSCDCSSADLKNNRPLCQPPGGGDAEETQYFGKAYPGLRSLEVLKGIGDSAIVASICPKVLTEGQAGYGYEPAVDAIIERLKVQLRGRCLPRPLAVEPGNEGTLPCVVIEASSPALSTGGACSCDAERRKPVVGSAQDLVRHQLSQRHECDTPTTPSCNSFCLCELEQAEGQTLDECLNSEAGSQTPGYCYVAPFGKEPQGNAKLVSSCPDGQKQLIRFVGESTPKPGATAFIACLGATIH